MTRTVWITHEEWPTSAEVLAQAIAAGATEVLHGVPAALADRIPADAVGLVELEEPELEEPDDVVEIHLDAAALLNVLTTTPPTTITQLRTALRNAIKGTP